jgi:hypothetical protein
MPTVGSRINMGGLSLTRCVTYRMRRIGSLNAQTSSTGVSAMA